MFQKKIILSVILLFPILSGFAQTAPATPAATTPPAPYIATPVLPSFKLRLMDSSLMNTSDIPGGKDIIFMFFSPTCEHCKMLTDSLISHMDELKDTRIYMCGVAQIYEIKDFAKEKKLNRFPNITMARDIDFFFIGFFAAKSFPFIAVYDGNKKLIKGFDGGMQLPELVSAIKQH